MPHSTAAAAATRVAGERLLNDHVRAYLAARDRPLRLIGELLAVEQARILRAALQRRPPSAHFDDVDEIDDDANGYPPEDPEVGVTGEPIYPDWDRPATPDTARTNQTPCTKETA